MQLLAVNYAGSDQDDTCWVVQCLWPGFAVAKPGSLQCKQPKCHWKRRQLCKCSSTHCSLLRGCEALKPTIPEGTCASILYSSKGWVLMFRRQCGSSSESDGPVYHASYRWESHQGLPRVRRLTQARGDAQRNESRQPITARLE